MPVKKTRPTLWILVPVYLTLAAAAILGTFNYGPMGNPSKAAIECTNLKKFIVETEGTGKSDWKDYRGLVDEYMALGPTANRAAIVEEIAFTLVQVLENDLKIYGQMTKFPTCLQMEKRDQLPGIIDETRSAIGFLSGNEAINGTYFDPTSGEWNPDYYSEYLSATEFLKNLRPNADV